MQILKQNKLKSLLKYSFLINNQEFLFLRHHAIRLLEKFYDSKVFTDVIKTERKKTFAIENGIYR